MMQLGSSDCEHSERTNPTVTVELYQAAVAPIFE